MSPPRRIAIPLAMATAKLLGMIQRFPDIFLAKPVQRLITAPPLSGNTCHGVRDNIDNGGHHQEDKKP